MTAMDADGLRQQGLSLARQKRWGEAEALLRRAAQMRPDCAETHNSLGVVLAEQSRHPEALDCFDQALRLRPDFLPPYQNRGNSLRKLGRLREALAGYEQALQKDPHWAEVHNNLGITLLDLKRPADAADRFRQALRHRPDFLQANNNLGVALAEQGRPGEAAAIYKQVLQKQPRSAETHNNLGVALAAARQFEPAVACYDQALRLHPAYAEAHSNRGNALRQLGRLREAEQSLRQALRLAPNYPEAHNNLAIVLVKGGDVAGALAEYNEALRLAPDYAEAHTNRALAWLQSGDFARGWQEYEWRWRTKDFSPRKFTQPRWDGGPLEGKTILLYSEQGLGDTLQFCRYASLLKQRGATVLLEAPAVLLPLLGRCPGIDRLLPARSALPDFDVQCPLLSLPALLGTTLDSVPAQVPYLSAEPERIERWRQRLAGLDGFKIGIAWQGSSRYPDDRFRSLPLKHFEPLAKIPGVRLVSLQKGHGSEQLRQFKAKWGVLEPEGLDDKGGAFLDTAAVMSCLDLVVTSDTSLPHLAGALGVPVWMVVGHASDWRWLLHREDCPWYPTMRLFRQQRSGDWDEVLQRVAAEVRRQRPAPAPSPRRPAELQQEGRDLCRQGRFAEAVGVLRQALQLRADSPPTWNNLGVALSRLGQWAEAARACEEALRLKPNYPEARHNLGEALHKLGRLDEAIDHYRRVLQLAPETVQTHNNLGVILAAQNRPAEAVACYREALRLSPDFSLAHHNLAAALEKQGDRRGARQHYRQALDRPGRTAADLVRLGEERIGQKMLAEAAACFELALERSPENAAARHRLGQLLAEMGDHADARRHYEQALQQRPGDPLLLHDAGNACRRQGLPVEAEGYYRQALQTRPADPVIHNHLGIALLDQGKLKEAEEAFRTSLRCDPRHAQAYNNLGVVMEQMRRMDDAAAAYDESLRLQPDNPETHRNRALVWLLRGDFQRGWQEYEWRWKCGNSVKRSFGRPRWDGGPLEGKTILLYSEQGLGDTLQFCRYASLLKQRGATVLLEAPAVLLPLLGRCPGIDRLLPAGSPLPDFDVQCPLLSLPALLGTTLDSVPAVVPYLSAEPARIERWRQLLAGLDGFKVGIAWQGSKKYAGDRHRSIPLKHFEPLAKIPGVRLVSLQKGHGSEQLGEFAAWGVLEPQGLDEEGGAFLDTAAVMSCLDLVVTSDTSLPHLAGALGLPVCMALSQASDWRWLLERQDCPWYPTLRLFRQKAMGDWDEVFARIAEEVSRRARAHAFRRPLCVELAPGELLDKLSILEIKKRRISDPARRHNVLVELGSLHKARAQALAEPAELAALLRDLRAVNERLWDVEDEIRDWERRQEFGGRFIELARSVYHLNDERAHLKRRINDRCGSALVEEKSYAPYAVQ